MPSPHQNTELLKVGNQPRRYLRAAFRNGQKFMKLQPNSLGAAQHRRTHATLAGPELSVTTLTDAMPQPLVSASLYVVVGNKPIEHRP